ncbi:thioredoxin-domain-containing protein [Panus rudis PR-1116 ss-1]|nr:thioredoxin-domain-containing protein [Panus rudis PR-1116 ss-1]
MSITHITSVSQLNSILSKSKDKVSVIDFHATWCGPCHMIAPVFEALAKQYKNVNFLKCDVDAAKDVAGLYGVSAMPTFIFLKGSAKVDQVRGADRTALQAAVSKWASQSAGTPAFQGTGRTLAGSSSSTPVGRQPTDLGAAVDGFTNLSPQAKVLVYLLGAYLLFWYLS